MLVKREQNKRYFKQQNKTVNNHKHKNIEIMPQHLKFPSGTETKRVALEFYHHKLCVT